MDAFEDLVLSDVHIYISPSRSKESNERLENITRFFFSFKDDSDQCSQDSNEFGSRLKEDEQNCTSKSSTNKDGDLVLPNPDEYTVQVRRRAKEVITVEHRLQTALKDVGFQVWLGSLLLCDYLLTHRYDLSRHSVLDLGAGAGLTSIVAAMFSKSVVCTDYTQDIVDLAERNWKRNSELLPAASSKEANITFEVLDWTNNGFHLDPDPADRKLSASLIIAAEVVYDDDLTDAFFQTIYYLLKNPPSKTVVIALERRIVFDSAWQDVCSPAYLHFQENMEDLCSVDEGDVCFDSQQIPTERVDQCFLYDRTAQLELWQITSSFEDKNAT